jgi:hypothetical protein
MALLFKSDDGESSQTQLNSIRVFFCTDGTYMFKKMLLKVMPILCAVGIKLLSLVLLKKSFPPV